MYVIINAILALCETFYDVAVNFNVFDTVVDF